MLFREMPCSPRVRITALFFAECEAERTCLLDACLLDARLFDAFFFGARFFVADFRDDGFLLNDFNQFSISIEFFKYQG